MQLKSADEPLHAIGQRDPADADDAVVVPRGIVAAELDLEANQAVALDPIAEQHRVAVLRLAPVSSRLERIEPADQMPHGQLRDGRRPSKNRPGTFAAKSTCESAPAK